MDYKRGDIFYVNSNGDKTVGSEQGAGRPAVIVSNDYGNMSGRNVTVVYLTSAEKRTMSVHAPVICKVPSTALCEQIYTVSKERLGEYVRTCTEAEMQGINHGILQALGLNLVFTLPNDKELKTQQIIIDDLKEQLRHAKAAQNVESIIEGNAMVAKVMIAKAEAERDVYKGLFESLQAQMMERKA